MEKVILLLNLLILLNLSAKVIYDFRPETRNLLFKSQKIKNHGNLRLHKENYFKLAEKLGLNYIVDWKSGVNEEGDTVKYFHDRLYRDKINLNKFRELQELGLKHFNEIELMASEIAKRNEISIYTLAYKVLSSDIVFTGTVKHFNPPMDGGYTKIEVEVDDFIKGTYYYNQIPQKFILVSEYLLLENGDWAPILPYENKLLVGKKYIFFEFLDNVDNNEIFSSTHNYLIENYRIIDEKWNFSDYNDISKLREYIKLLDKTNETEKFFDIDFK